MKSMYSREELAESLLGNRNIAPQEMRTVFQDAKKEKKQIFQFLVQKDILKEDEVIEFLSDRMEIPVLNLSALRIPKEIIKLIPRKIVDRYQIFPLARIQNLLSIATSDPFELMLYDDIKGITGCDICLVLAPSRMIAGAIENYYSDAGSFESVLEGIDDENLEVVRSGGDDPENDEKNNDGSFDQAPVVRMVNIILDEAIRQRASDIHFEPYEKHFRVRYRIDGAAKEAFSNSRELYGSIVARIKIMSLLNITEKRLPQDGRFRASIRGREIDFRVSILPIYHGEKVVLRVLDRGGVKAGLDKLGFSEKPTRAFAEAVKHPYGMILVTGPTGSGKSTTLYTILNTLNTPDRNIMTVEDPVEYQVEGITQTQVHAEIGMTFANGLRALLRQSPDVVLVGEIRDTETADIAVKAALTGHLVFSTLHTNSAAGAMTRLVDMGVEPFLIASSVICVAAQRLLRRVCPHCKEPVKLSDDVIRRCHGKQSELRDITAFRGRGCAKCTQTGYYGRLGAIEVLAMDPLIRELVMQRKSSDEIEKVAIQKGMETLFENAFNLFKNGMTTLDEVLRVSTPE